MHAIQWSVVGGNLHLDLWILKELDFDGWVIGARGSCAMGLLNGWFGFGVDGGGVWVWDVLGHEWVWGSVSFETSSIGARGCESAWESYLLFSAAGGFGGAWFLANIFTGYIFLFGFGVCWIFFKGATYRIERMKIPLFGVLFHKFVIQIQYSTRAFFSTLHLTHPQPLHRITEPKRSSLTLLLPATVPPPKPSAYPYSDSQSSPPS